MRAGLLYTANPWEFQVAICESTTTKGARMLIFDEDRPSDSPFVEQVWRCHSEGATPFLSIAASRCELVVSRLEGQITLTVRGPESRATLQGDCPGDGK